MTTSDWVLAAYIFLLVPAMLIGFGFARRKLFEPHHKLMMTTITLVNWLLIIFVMLVTYRRDVAPQVPQHLNFSSVFIPSLHLLTGLVAQLIASYLVLRMWFEKRLPEWIKVKNIKIYMRTTLVLWLLTALLGLGVWATFYHDFLISPPVASAANANPGVTVVQLTNGNHFAPAELSITTGTTVHFVNADTKVHTVTADDGSFDSGDLKPGAFFDHTFTQPGDIRYYCAYHGDKGGVGMAAIMHVTGAALPASTQNATSAPVKPAATSAATMDMGTSAATSPAQPAATSGATQAGTSQAAQAGQTVTVSMTDDNFTPAELTIAPGTTVHFINNGKHKHTVTADDDSFDSGQLTTGKTFDLTLTKVGDVPLYCANHGDKGGVGMSMVIHVTGPGAAPAATSGATAQATPAATHAATTAAQPASTSAATSVPATKAVSAPASTSAATTSVGTALNPTAIAALSPLVISATDTPKTVAYLLGVKTQAAVIATQVTTLTGALQQGHIEDAQAAAEGIINTINGGKGADLDKNGNVYQPGDGYGLQQYVFSLNETANTAAGVAGISDTTRQSLAAMQTVGRLTLTDMQNLTTQAQA
ncbi:MAG: cupredoxin domain-containing protein, partial [Aggregatilineales bacterium]